MTDAWGKTALHNAILSDNDLAIIELLLDHGADPTAIAERPERARRGLAIARRSRWRPGGDAATCSKAFARRGFSIESRRASSVCSPRARWAMPRHVADRSPQPSRPLVTELRADGGRFLAGFAGVGNTEGVRLLLDLGVPVDAPFVEGEGYFDVAPEQPGDPRRGLACAACDACAC